MSFPNDSLLHSEAALSAWLKKQGFGMAGNKIVIEAIFSERQPCSDCQDVIKELCYMNCAPFNVYFLIDYPVPSDNQIGERAATNLLQAYSVAGFNLKAQ